MVRAGRPAVLEDPVQRWVQFEREDLKEADKLAKERGISFAELCRKALAAYMRARKRKSR